VFLDLGNPVAKHPLNDGLVGWWLGLPNNSGASTWFDLVSGQHGTLTSGYTWTADPAGRGALSLSSANAYLPDRAFGTGAYSAACWFYPTGLGSYQNLLRSDGGSGGSGNYWILRVNPSAGLDWYAATAAGGSITAGSLSNNQWYLALGTRSASGATALYSNGVSIGTSSGVPASAGGSGNNTWVGSLSATFEFFAGTIGAAWLWDRELSASEVWSLYDQVSRGHPDTLRRWSRRSRGYVATSPPPATSSSNLLLLGCG